MKNDNKQLIGLLKQILSDRKSSHFEMQSDPRQKHTSNNSLKLMGFDRDNRKKVCINIQPNMVSYKSENTSTQFLRQGKLHSCDMTNIYYIVQKTIDLIFFTSRVMIERQRNVLLLEQEL